MAIGKLYLVGEHEKYLVPEHIERKYFIVRSCRNSDFYVRKGWYILPQLSPNPSLFSDYLKLKAQGQWNRHTFDTIYTPQFLEQMRTDNVMRGNLNGVKRLLDEGHDVAFMCYCDTDLCHRFILGEQYRIRGYEVISISGV